MTFLNETIIQSWTYPSMWGIILPLLLLLVVWSMVWKLLALWKAARNNSLVWFIVLGVVNTLGILEILYIFIFSKMKGSSKSSKVTAKKPSRKKRR
jgi:methionyl-tRNA synthetase